MASSLSSWIPFFSFFFFHLGFKYDPRVHQQARSTKYNSRSFASGSIEGMLDEVTLDEFLNAVSGAAQENFLRTRGQVGSNSTFN